MLAYLRTIPYITSSQAKIISIVLMIRHRGYIGLSITFFDYDTCIAFILTLLYTVCAPTASLATDHTIHAKGVHIKYSDRLSMYSDTISDNIATNTIVTLHNTSNIESFAAKISAPTGFVNIKQTEITLPETVEAIIDFPNASLQLKAKNAIINKHEVKFLNSVISSKNMLISAQNMIASADTTKISASGNINITLSTSQ